MITSGNIYKIVIRGQVFGIVDSMNLAPVEETQYASQRYTVGKYLIYQGFLCRTTVDISAGTTLVIGDSGNLEKVQVSSELMNLKNDIDNGLAQVNERIDNYRIPVASADTVGGVKIGSGINLDSDGKISITPYSLPTASYSTKGGIKIPSDSGVFVNNDGLYLSTATSTLKGGVKVSSSQDNGVYMNSEQLRTRVASYTQLGCIKIGYGLSVSSTGGVSLKAAKQYTSGSSSSDLRGGIYIREGNGFNLDGDGELYVKVNGNKGLFRDNDGIGLQNVGRNLVTVQRSSSQTLSGGESSSGTITIPSSNSACDRLKRGFIEGMYPALTTGASISSLIATIKGVSSSSDGISIAYTVHNLGTTPRTWDKMSISYGWF